MKITKAVPGDKAQIAELLDELDLYHASCRPEDFWIAKKDESVIGIACLTDMGEYLYLSSVGVAAGHRKRGVARALLEAALKNAEKDVYLYTVIPGFFKKTGFEISEPPKVPPPKDALECEACQSSKCVCMRKPRTEPA